MTLICGLKKKIGAKDIFGDGQTLLSCFVYCETVTEPRVKM